MLSLHREKKSFKTSFLFQIFTRKEVIKMDEKRKGEIALAAMKIVMREELSFRDITNLKRNIGNRVKEREMLAINATTEELLDLTKSLLEEVFATQMKAIS